MSASKFKNMDFSRYDKIFILCDETVAAFWLPEFAHNYGLKKTTDIVIKGGEKSKTLRTVEKIWKTFVKHEADSNSLLINLGGGVVCDIGGFAASCYQRGIDFVNVPTTLLAMVDAAVGGKNGINFKGIKNKIGSVNFPKEVIIDKLWLSTLDERNIRSGIGEMLKYGLIADKTMLNINVDNYSDYIEKAISIKNEIVSRDANDRGVRKILNFGHTIGHALEAVRIEEGVETTHGECVAFGMLCALRMSHDILGLSEDVIKRYEKAYKSNCFSECVSSDEIAKIIEKIHQDKKNKDGKAMFVLLEDIEKPVFDIEVPYSDIEHYIY